MAGLVKSAALPNMLCCICEGFLREHWLHVHKSGLSRIAVIGPTKMLRSIANVRFGPALTDT